MANFWDLPKQVREKIYRLHLVQEDPIDRIEFEAHCGGGLRSIHSLHGQRRAMPQLLQLSKKAENEAAPIYFRENTCIWNMPYETWIWKVRIWPRHLKLIQKVVIDGWEDPQDYGKGYNEPFRLLGSFKGLLSLTLKVDEQIALESRLARHPTIKWHRSLGCSPQLQLQALHFGGIHGLKSLSIPRLEFEPLTKEDHSGAISGGVLDTVVRREVTQPPRFQIYNRQGPFRFLDLPPELRNKIYSLLLVFPGVTYPKVDKPTSVTCQFPYLRFIERDSIAVLHSALAILQTNRLVHNEAAALFYRKNDLVFSYPAHLQDFIQSLERDRLESVSSLTLFHKNHIEGGISTMATTLKLIRRMRGLKKFHLLVEYHLVNGPQWRGAPLGERCVSRIQGIAVLFTLRGISDIKVRDLDLEDRMQKFVDRGETINETIKELAQVLKHFNHGLALAQKGIVVKELFDCEMWSDLTYWPAFGESKCNRSVGCLCGEPVVTEEEEDDNEATSSSD